MYDFQDGIVPFKSRPHLPISSPKPLHIAPDIACVMWRKAHLAANYDLRRLGKEKSMHYETSNSTGKLFGSAIVDFLYALILTRTRPFLLGGEKGYALHRLRGCITKNYQYLPVDVEFSAGVLPSASKEVPAQSTSRKLPNSERYLWWARIPSITSAFSSLMTTHRSQRIQAALIWH